MGGLRLGAIIDDKPVKITMELPGGLARLLAEYADVHARVTGLASPLPLEKLVPPMIERFVASDREFSKLRRRG